MDDDSPNISFQLDNISNSCLKIANMTLLFKQLGSTT